MTWTESTELQRILQDALRRRLGRRLRIVQLQRRVSSYLTSFPIEELAVQLHDGTTLELIFKNLDWHMLSEEVQRVKPRFLYDPRREVQVYRAILPSAPAGPPLYYGSLVDAQKGRYWLFLEKVEGLELYQVGELERWQAAAAWLAQLHSAFQGNRDSVEGRSALEGRAPLLRYDEEFYWRWLRRARRFAAQNAEAPREAKAGMEWLARRYGRVVAQLVTLPVTFIHGEFYASNVLIGAPSGSAAEPDTYRVAPVDWEVAAIGPGVFDLAALTAGKWTEDQQQAMARAYFEALPKSQRWPGDLGDVVEAMYLAQLAIAVQWLGWAQQWSPPVETGHNWLNMALQLGEKLGI